MQNSSAGKVHAVSVALLARTHGNKWQNVEDNAKIRVSNAGKRIRIVLSVGRQCSVDWSSLKFDLHDLAASSVGLDSVVSNWTHVGNPHVSESRNRCSIELHLELSRKPLQFKGKLSTDSGEELTFSTVTFRCSNSGTSQAERRKDDLLQTCADYLDIESTNPPSEASPTFISQGNWAVQGQVIATQCLYHRNRDAATILA
jgi:hypothetical protein